MERSWISQQGKAEASRHTLCRTVHYYLHGRALHYQVEKKGGKEEEAESTTSHELCVWTMQISSSAQMLIFLPLCVCLFDVWVASLHHHHHHHHHHHCSGRNISPVKGGSSQNWRQSEMAEPHSAAAKRGAGGDTFSFTQISRQKTQHTEDCNAVRILISQIVKDQGPEVHQRACVWTSWLAESKKKKKKKNRWPNSLSLFFLSRQWLCFAKRHQILLFSVSTIIPRTRSKHTQGKHTCTLLPESTGAKVVHVFRRTIHPVTGISANNSGKSKRSTDLFN